MDILFKTIRDANTFEQNEIHKFTINHSQKLKRCRLITY